MSSSSISGNPTNPSSPDYPLIPYSSVRSTSSNCRSTDSKIVNIVNIALICSIGLAFAGVALALELTKPVVVIMTVVGLGIIPTIESIVNRLSRQGLFAAVPATATRFMSIEEARGWLNVPPESANNSEFIKAQYEKHKKATISKRGLDSTSLLNIMINETLQDIEQAYTVLMANCSRQT